MLGLPGGGGHASLAREPDAPAVQDPADTIQYTMNIIMKSEYYNMCIYIYIYRERER